MSQPDAHSMRQAAGHVHETLVLGPLRLSRPVYVFYERELIRRCRRLLAA